MANFVWISSSCCHQVCLTIKAKCALLQKMGISVFPSGMLSFLSLSLCLGSIMWELLLQGIRSGPVHWTHTDCGGQGFASADGFASAGETEPAPGR